MKDLEQEKKSGEKLFKEEYRQSILLFLRFSGWIAGPVIIAALLGNWLDARYDTSPWLFLSILGGAFIVSMIGLAREAAREYRRIEEEERKRKENTKTKKDKEENVPEE